MNVLDLYRDDINGQGNVISVSGGREFRGPCPICGGEDRFGVWPEQNNGKGSFYCGRGAGTGNGCEIGGDAIEYLRKVRNYTYHEACECLGIEPKRGGKHLRYTAPKVPRNYTTDNFVARKLSWPEEVVDPQTWCEHGMKFVDACHAALLNRPTSIGYLMSRGIGMEMIKKYRLGFHAGENRDGKEYLPSFRPWPSWGLKPEKGPDKKKYRMLILPAGLVIPYIVDGVLHRLTIRLIKPDPRQPKKKYHYVRGSIRDVWMSNPSAKAFVVSEAELDCIAIDGAAGELVGTIGLGSTGVKPDARAENPLAGSMCILGALDFDEPRKNPRTGEIERPGSKAGSWWKKQYSQFKRWPVPKGKDAGEAFGLGVDLRLWILAGLPKAFQNQASSTAKKSQRRAEDQRIAKILHEKKFPPTSEVKELKMLLQESDGFIRIYGDGAGVGPEIDQNWSVKNSEKRRRISELLYNSESVNLMICNLPDGNYKAVNLPVYL